MSAENVNPIKRLFRLYRVKGGLSAVEVAKKFLSLLHPQGNFDIRLLKPVEAGKCNLTGVFDSSERAVHEVFKHDGNFAGIYFGLNPTGRERTEIHRKNGNVTIRPKNNLWAGGLASRKEDILHRNHLLIDIESVRETDTNATEAGILAALAVAQQIVDATPEAKPLVTCSGNGIHVIYRIDLPNDDDATLLVGRALDGLATLHDSKDATIDTKVKDASRICKLPGTTVKKGPHSEERPHRRAFVIDWRIEGVLPVSRLKAWGIAAPSVALARPPAPVRVLSESSLNTAGRPSPATRISLWLGGVAGVAEGGRNNRLFGVAKDAFRGWGYEVDGVAVEHYLRDWNQTCCRPPLSEDEFSATVASARDSVQRDGGPTFEILHEVRPFVEAGSPGISIPTEEPPTVNHSLTDRPQKAPTVASGWAIPEPIPVREGREAFEPPLWVLPPDLMQMVNRISAAKQVPQGSILGTLLGLLSAVSAGRYVARIAPQYNSHSHIWALLSVRSSGGKSEPAATLSPAIAKAERRHKEDADRYNCANAAERANLSKQIEAMENGSAEDFPGQLFECKQRLAAIAKRPPVRYLRKDATPQKIGILYARHQVVSIFIAEAADFIANFMGYSGGRDSVAYLTAMLSGHTVEPFGEDRVGREESHCERPVLSMFLACQEKNTVRLLKDETALDRGLCSRLLVFQGESWVGKRRPYDQRPNIQDSDLETWAHLVDTVTRHEPDRDEDGWIPMHIPVHPEASALYSRIFEVVEKRLGHDSPDLPLNDRDDITGKVQEVIGRLAVLVHVIWTARQGKRPTSEPITGASVVYGFALAIWSLRSYFEIAGVSMPSVGGQNEALDLWNSLRANLVTQKGYCTLKEWLRLGPSKWRNALKTSRHMAVLEELGYVQVYEQKNSRGPASKIIQLNPLAQNHSPEKVATVATVEQDPMFIELLQAQGLKLPFATVANVSGNDRLSSPQEADAPCSEAYVADAVAASLGDW